MLEFEVGPSIDADLSTLASAEPVPPVEQFYNHVDPRRRAAATLFVGWAQTFEATSSFDLTRVQLPLGRGEAGTVTLQLLGTTASGDPDSADVLATATASVPAGGDYSLIGFDLPASVRLTAEERYALFARGPNLSWAGQIDSQSPAVRLYYDPANWKPFQQPAGLYFLLFDQ
jgi:hypothetical protein